MPKRLLILTDEELDMIIKWYDYIASYDTVEEDETELVERLRAARLK